MVSLSILNAGFVHSWRTHVQPLVSFPFLDRLGNSVTVWEWVRGNKPQMPRRTKKGEKTEEKKKGHCAAPDLPICRWASWRHAGRRRRRKTRAGHLGRRTKKRRRAGGRRKAGETGKKPKSGGQPHKEQQQKNPTARCGKNCPKSAKKKIQKGYRKVLSTLSWAFTRLVYSRSFFPIGALWASVSSGGCDSLCHISAWAKRPCNKLTSL